MHDGAIIEKLKIYFSFLKVFKHKHSVCESSLSMLMQGNLEQCGNFKIFLSFRFYVKSTLENIEVLKLPFFCNFMGTSRNPQNSSHVKSE